MAGRKSTLQKQAESNQQQSSHIVEDIATPIESFAINPNIDYDKVTDEIAKLEAMTNGDAAFTSPPSTFEEEMDYHLKNATSATARGAYTSPTLYSTDTPSSKTHVRQAIDLPQTQRVVTNALKGTVSEKPTPKPLPPLHDDFLAFLIEKNPLSFGWVVDPTFFLNFDLNPAIFKEKDPFILWIVPASINIFKIATAGGFQRSESRNTQLHPHVFLIKLLEIKDEDAEADPFIEIINDPAYLKLRESLEQRGIQFIYDHSPQRIWMSVLSERLKK
jgi:hypothetical protein